MIEITRDLRSGPPETARVSLRCDRCRREGRQEAFFDADDLDAAEASAVFLSAIMGWAMVGRRVLCCRCRPDRRPARRRPGR